ncbi:MAG: DUF1109 domain-containing protein [Burkholderiales bacterium]|nr:DUF1109 domain-containing protein [Burkholderiales bacterium]
MDTNELIRMLASDTQPVVLRAWRRRYGWVLAGGLSVALLLMAGLLGVRPDIAAAALLPMFWVKLAFPAAFAAAALLALARLARPGLALGRAGIALAAPVLAIWVLAALSLLGASSDDRSALLWGETWSSCLINVPMLAVPAFVLLLGVLKTLAPVRPALAGAAAGALSGGLGALAYALHCPELAPAFIGLWYLLGMLIPAALGALIGARLLRW